MSARSFGFASYVSDYSFSPSVYSGAYSTGYRTYRTAPAAPSSYANSSLVRAARIADQRAHPHSQWRCWQYVKDALLQAGAVSSRPKTAYARQAGAELTQSYGFVDTHIRDPYRAPVGAVIVYGGHGAGHVELRTEHGFASDYRSRYRCRYSQIIGIYVKGSQSMEG